MLAGLRYAQNKQVFSEVGDGPVTGHISLLNQKSHENVKTYSVAARYHFNPDVMTYVRVATGYRPGGPNLAIAGIPPTFDSDSLTNYEAGIKSMFFDSQVLLNAEAFLIKWKDIQLLSNGAGFNHLVNGGSAKSQGLEANATFRPVDGLNFDASFAYIDSVLTEDVPDIGGLDGDRLPNIPRLSGSLRATYSFNVIDDWEGTVGAGLRLVGRRYSNVNNASDSRQLAGYEAVDLNASVGNDQYTVRFYVKNLTDKKAYLTFNPLVNQASGDITQIEGSVIQPRTIGVSFDANF